MQETYLTRRFGDLVPVRQLHNGLWRYQCARVRANGEVCGIFRDLRRESARNYFCCAACGELLRSQPKPRRKKTISTRNFTHVRAEFTPEQWKLYYEYLGRRKSFEDQKEAVELVMLDLPNKGLRRAA